jgi:SAM-dependent methyltransferase
MNNQFSKPLKSHVLQDVVEHFTARAPGYDRSSHWCEDPVMMSHAIQASAPTKHDRMLDVACGTGLVSSAFRPHVKEIVGLDLTPAMAAQAKVYLDDFVLGSAEHMPFKDGEFDLAVCRQGIQFMDALPAATEMGRVTRSGGRVLLINLCAYGDGDEEEYFEILRLRNPARRNFFVPEDIGKLLHDSGCKKVTLNRFVSSEDIDTWSGNGAIEESNRARIRDIYHNASKAFQHNHKVQILDDGRIVDQMLFVIAVGWR